LIAASTMLRCNGSDLIVILGRMTFLFRDTRGACLAPLGGVVCIGAFDGLHRGHQAMLARVFERASAMQLLPAAISFEPLPREFFARGVAMPRLSNAREKIAGIAASGMQRLLSLRFDANLSAISAEDFVARVLVERLNAREVWVGQGFRFGHKRAGDFALLQQLGPRFGFIARELESIQHDGVRISSSAIREALAASDFKSAARGLGRPFSMGGHVVRGRQLGRTLGYPTANLRLGTRVAPVQGIFAVYVHGVTAAPWPGVASLGVRPTVNGKEPLLEAHLFDFDGDLYGRRISVEFVAKLRDEAKFDNLDAMVEQIHLDAATARHILNFSEKTVEAGA
jgi:riboflavin kinase/FMN adenylyltransferase